MADLYANFGALAQSTVHILGRDYDINIKEMSNVTALFKAIHGGGIEAGTSEIVKEAAKDLGSYYEFDAKMSSGNGDLHITSTNYDEPRLLDLMTRHSHVISVHGYGDTAVKKTLLGGKDAAVRAIVKEKLTKAGFVVEDADSSGGIAGLEPGNVVNQTTRSMGIQLELSTALRKSFFTNDDYSRANRLAGNYTTDFWKYVNALREIMMETTAKYPFSHVKYNGREHVETLKLNHQAKIDVLSQKTNGDVSILEFESYKVSVASGYDWQPAFAKAISYAETNKKRLIIMPLTYSTSAINIENVDGLTIEFLSGSKLISLTGVEGRFITIKSSKNVTLNAPLLDGQSTYYQGIGVLDNNENIYVNDSIIKNISPIITATSPRDINSVGLFISTMNNKRIFINNIKIDGVKNNDNSTIGDSIGSSRGILIDKATGTDTVSLEVIRINGVDIKNVLSEDGDGIQLVGYNNKVDLKIHDVVLDNCKRRGVKFQSIRGVEIDGIKIKQTDRTFSMATGISMLTSGNVIKNLEVDIKAVKGVELNPSQNTDYKTMLQNAKITMSNDATLEGSNVYAVDVLDLGTGITVNNFVMDDLDLLTPNQGIIIRAYTRNNRYTNIKHKSYTGDKYVINLTFEPPATTASDGTNVSHKGLYINNVVGETFAFYSTATTTFAESTLGDAIALNGSDPYVQMYTRKQIQIKKREFSSTTMPTSGSYVQGDYVRKSSYLVSGTVGSQYIVKGWFRLTTGSSHVLGADWIEDRYITGT